VAVKKSAATVPEAVEAVPEEVPPPHAVVPPDPGWWRNVGETPLDVVGEGVGLTLAPGRIAPLPWVPTHRDLAPATRAEFDAQTRADAAAEAAANAPQAEPAPIPAPEAMPEPAQSQE
jgi:hypothetical protein